jgi:hypothetical protein
MHTTDRTMTTSHSEQTGALLRHFADLRDGTHGGARSRPDKQRLCSLRPSRCSIVMSGRHSGRSTLICCSAPAT